MKSYNVAYSDEKGFLQRLTNAMFPVYQCLKLVTCQLFCATFSARSLKVETHLLQSVVSMSQALRYLLLRKP